MPLLNRTTLALILLTLTACGHSKRADQDTPTHCPTAYYGDSIAWQVEHSIHADPAVDYYTYPGMSLLGTHPRWPDLEIDKSYCRIFIGLGTNQASDHAGELRSLQAMLAGIEDRAICILPMTKYGILVEPQRTLLKTHCPRFIDPILHGVYPLATDEVHLHHDDADNNIGDYARLIDEKYAISTPR